MLLRFPPWPLEIEQVCEAKDLRCARDSFPVDSHNPVAEDRLQLLAHPKNLREFHLPIQYFRGMMKLGAVSSWVARRSKDVPRAKAVFGGVAKTVAGQEIHCRQAVKTGVGFQQKSRETRRRQTSRSRKKSPRRKLITRAAVSNSCLARFSTFEDCREFPREIREALKRARQS